MILETIGYCLLIFAFSIYLNHLDEINQEMVDKWKKAIKEARITYQKIHWPNGYIPGKYKHVNNWPDPKNGSQQYYKNHLYNRKMMKR